MGTHSLQKGSATHASCCGVSRNFVNTRGQWRVREAIVDTYIDTILPYPDACITAALCGPGGACKYKLKSTNEIDKTFLLQNIAVNTARLLGNQAGLVLAVLLI